MTNKNKESPFDCSNEIAGQSARSTTINDHLPIHTAPHRATPHHTSHHYTTPHLASLHHTAPQHPFTRDTYTHKHTAGNLLTQYFSLFSHSTIHHCSTPVHFSTSQHAPPLLPKSQPQPLAALATVTVPAPAIVITTATTASTMVLLQRLDRCTSARTVQHSPQYRAGQGATAAQSSLLSTALQRSTSTNSATALHSVCRLPVSPYQAYYSLPTICYLLPATYYRMCYLLLPSACYLLPDD